MAKKTVTLKKNKMWGGRFETSPADVMIKINASIDFDKKLFSQDIAGSIAHAKMLGEQKIIPVADVKKIITGLTQIKSEIESGKFLFKPELEDIHMNIESRLKEIIGDAAGKLHTARSRNDQVALDFRLWVREEIRAIGNLLQKLQNALIKQAEGHIETIMPGFTHLQVAQPVSFAHHLLAYVEMFGRDRGRLKDADSRMNECPLGSAALAGTSYQLDRQFVAKELGFKSPTRNSMDAVADRDFALEFLTALSIVAVHLSRLAEEIVIWSSQQFSFVTLSDSFSTGSSIMPQKKNPDSAELVRGKSGRVFGNLVSLLTMLKGLPLTYSKDMQEDKEAVFDASETIRDCLAVTAGFIAEMRVNKKAMLESASLGFSTATDLADWLVKELKLPFREAHHVTGSLVKKAEKKGVRLDQLSLKEMQEVEKRITKSIFDILSVEKSVASRKSFGGTAPSQVKEALKTARKIYL